jgi:hypothetical protein
MAILFEEILSALNENSYGYKVRGVFNVGALPEFTDLDGRLIIKKSKDYRVFCLKASPNERLLFWPEKHGIEIEKPDLSLRFEDVSDNLLTTAESAGYDDVTKMTLGANQSVQLVVTTEKPPCGIDLFILPETDPILYECAKQIAGKVVNLYNDKTRAGLIDDEKEGIIKFLGPGKKLDAQGNFYINVFLMSGIKQYAITNAISNVLEAHLTFETLVAEEAMKRIGCVSPGLQQKLKILRYDNPK